MLIPVHVKWRRRVGERKGETEHVLGGGERMRGMLQQERKDEVGVRKKEKEEERMRKRRVKMEEPGKRG